MRCKVSSPALLLLCALVPVTLLAQNTAQKAGQKAPQRSTQEPVHTQAERHRRLTTASPRQHSPLVTSAEGLSVISAALESRGHVHAKPDCSHLVHTIYDRAGFPYTYVSSSDLYHGVKEFRHVLHPQPGDVVAWTGHVGIVVNPAQNTFFSSLRTGLGVESYSAPYWKERGPHRFYRYTKSPA